MTWWLCDLSSKASTYWTRIFLVALTDVPSVMRSTNKKIETTKRRFVAFTDAMLAMMVKW
jgi:hypothetical protein